MTETKKAEILRQFNREEIALHRELELWYKEAYLKFLDRLEPLRDKLTTDLDALRHALPEEE